MGLQRHSLRHEVEEEENSRKSIVLEVEDVEVDNNKKKSLKSFDEVDTGDVQQKRNTQKKSTDPYSRCNNAIFLLTGLRIYTGEYKAQGPTLCPTEGRALRGPRALYSPV